jgi:tetratricopeptide (TPR) repeat protein
MNADDLYRKGRDAMDAGRLLEAVACLQASAAEWPHFKTLELLGECLLGLKQPREAIVPLAAAAALNRQARAPSLLARAFLETGTWREAFDQAEEALRRAPDNELALEVRQAARRHLEADG